MYVCEPRRAKLNLMEFPFVRRHVFRFNAILLRERFEQNKNIQDMRIARKLLTEGERELFEKQHPQPISCTYPAGYAGTVSVAFPVHLSAIYSVVTRSASY